MLYYFSVTFYIITCFLLILIILIQKSKGSLGLGAFGGSSQMLFGGSGGQDVFQKITWTLISIFLIGSLGLAIMRARIGQTSAYIRHTAPAAQKAVLPDYSPEMDTESANS